MMKTSIVDLNQCFYIPAVQKLAFHLQHTCIIGTHNCGNKRWEAFKRLADYHDFLFHWDYAERLVDIFAHHIKSAYYGDNIYVSIEVIAL